MTFTDMFRVNLCIFVACEDGVQLLERLTVNPVDRPDVVVHHLGDLLPAAEAQIVEFQNQFAVFVIDQIQHFLGFRFEIHQHVDLPVQQFLDFHQADDLLFIQI